MKMTNKQTSAIMGLITAIVAVISAFLFTGESEAQISGTLPHDHSSLAKGGTTIAAPTLTGVTAINPTGGQDITFGQDTGGAQHVELTAYRFHADSGSIVTSYTSGTIFQQGGDLTITHGIGDNVIIWSSPPNLILSDGSAIQANVSNSVLSLTDGTNTTDITAVSADFPADVTIGDDLIVIDAITAGRIIVDSVMEVFGSRGGVKLANESRTSTTTLADDAELEGYVLPVGQYFFEGFVIFTSASATPNAKFRVRESGAGSVDKFSISTRCVNDSSGLVLEDFLQDTTNNFVVTLDGTNDVGCEINGSFRVNSASMTMALQWAQNTSDPTGTQLSDSSFINFTRVN